MKDVIWVVQYNLVQKNTEWFAQAVQDSGATLIGVKVIPHSDGEMEFLEQPAHDNVVPYGSNALVKYAPKNWRGNFFDDDKLRPSEWIKHRDDLLNQKFVLTTFGEARNHMDDEQSWFVKPNDDLKTFAGEVTNRSAFITWSDKILGKGYAFDGDLPVIVAPYKDIYSEYRFFIVDNEVVDGTRYKANGRVRGVHLDDKDPMMEVAREFARRWLPFPVVSMDLAITSEGVKLIEFGAFNATGWYDNDLDKIVRAVNAYMRK